MGNVSEAYANSLEARIEELTSETSLLQMQVRRNEDLLKHSLHWGHPQGGVYGKEEVLKHLNEMLLERKMYVTAQFKTEIALERIAAALEERLPPIEDANKIEALQARIVYLENQLKIAEMQLMGQSPGSDLGVACFRCGGPMTGVTAVTGKAFCADCFPDWVQR